MNPTLVWFRRDLRLGDHEPLARSIEDGGATLAVYCLDPRDFEETHVGDFPKTGAHRTRFLLESLHDLRERCRERGGDLVVRRGRPEEVLPEVARTHGVRTVRFHREVASEELAVERRVTVALSAHGIAASGAWGHTLIHPEDLPFAIEDLPEIFTQFRVQVEKATLPRAPIAAPPSLPPLPFGLDPGTIPTLEELGMAVPPHDPRQRMVFRGGETAGLARLGAWAFESGALGTYKETRNGLLAADDSSKLSPWLALGCLSPRHVHAEVRRYERERVKNESTYWMIFELYWRDYFRFVVAKHGDRMFHAGGLIGATIAWRHDRAALETWRRGLTGFPLVDAAMRELLATGYTSNRARQNVASFLTKNLGIDWRFGAAWFESQLVDYDVTSNWGNWAYAAGVGNDARGFRFFNLAKQADDYDPAGHFARHWVPELAALAGGRIYRPDQQSGAELARLGIRLGQDYPAPMVHFRESASACQKAYEEGVRGAARRPGQLAKVHRRR